MGLPSITVTNFYFDRVPQKRRTRITLQQFKAICDSSSECLQWLLTLAFHFALHRVGLLNLCFDDVVYDRIVSSIRKADTRLRTLASHRYPTAGYDVGAVQDLIAHTEPEMPWTYQKGHARKMLRVEMT